MVPQCHASCQGGDGTDPARRNRQKGRRAWSNGHARRVAMVVLSKSTGAGAPERNWADVKVVYDKKKTSSNPERVEKKAKIYGMSRRDPTLSGKLSSS